MYTYLRMRVRILKLSATDSKPNLGEKMYPGAAQAQFFPGLMSIDVTRSRGRARGGHEAEFTLETGTFWHGQLWADGTALQARDMRWLVKYTCPEPPGGDGSTEHH